MGIDKFANALCGPESDRSARFETRNDLRITGRLLSEVRGLHSCPIQKRLDFPKQSFRFIH
jgi:hypothetical protein